MGIKITLFDPLPLNWLIHAFQCHFPNGHLCLDAVPFNIFQIFQSHSAYLKRKVQSLKKCPVIIHNAIVSSEHSSNAVHILISIDSEFLITWLNRNFNIAKATFDQQIMDIDVIKIWVEIDCHRFYWYRFVYNIFAWNKIDTEVKRFQLVILYIYIFTEVIFFCFLLKSILWYTIT